MLELLRLGVTVLSTIAVCVAVSILAPQGNLIALILFGWGCANLGVLTMSIMRRIN